MANYLAAHQHTPYVGEGDARGRRRGGHVVDRPPAPHTADRLRSRRDDQGPGDLPLLDGYRGRPKADVPALRGLVLRVGALAQDLPEVVEVDFNPVIVGPDGAQVVDAGVRVEQREPAPPEGARPRPQHSVDDA